MIQLPRSSGLLLPLFSLRSKHDVGVGDFGGVEGLLEWLAKSGQKLLMVLPLLPTGVGDPSPYGTRSAFGFNPLFIHLGWLPEGVQFDDADTKTIERAQASPTIRYEDVFRVKYAALERAFATFEQQGPSGRSREFERYCELNRDWLDAFALYQALSISFGFKPWWEWPEGLATRQNEALLEARRQHWREVRYQQWLQWVAESQWLEVRKKAKALGVELWGDEPFIIGQDSADCWCWPQYLRRDARLGVPPDDFSADGQDWGLPWFDFEAMEQTGNVWLKARAAKAASYFDARRVDHAIGYFRQYLRDAEAPKGRFHPLEQAQQRARGERNFKLLSADAGIVAEDLGVIPRFARDVLASLGLPGYQVMRWSREDGVYRDPRHYPEISLVTTGTHDTDTLRAWWQTASDEERRDVARAWPQLHHFSPAPQAFTPEVHEGLLNAALQSNSRWCVLPWQDVFGEAERVNTPGTVGGHNWAYRIRENVEALTTSPDSVRVGQWLARLTHHAKR